MPGITGGRYRYKKGTSTRLHFTDSGAVNEAKNMDSGATHTPAEFAADRRKTKMKPLRPSKGPGGLMRG